ncbi:hypothetical protein [Spirosoma montaniterrae]|nr:hypothetical protein [Spirosoma montaniterrae]
MKRILLLSLWLGLLLTFGLGLQNCKKDPDPTPTKPPVTTTPGSTTTSPGTSTTATTSTAPGISTATAPTATGVTSASARVSAVIEGNGGAAISQHGFVYSKTSQTPTLNDSKTELGATSGPFPLTISSNLTGLEGNARYYVRAYATNATGTSYGGGGAFTTLPAGTSFSRVSWEVHSSAFPKVGLINPIVVSHNNKLYTVGGSFPAANQANAGNFTYNNEFWEYDIASKKWTQLVNAPGQVFANTGFASRFIYNNNLWVADFTQFYEYDFTKKVWSVKFNLPKINGSRTQALVGDKLYLISIFASQPTQVVDLKNGTLAEIPALRTEAGNWFPSNATFVKDKRIYFWATTNTNNVPDVKMYTYYLDTETNTYTNLGMPNNLAPVTARQLSPNTLYEKDGILYIMANVGGVANYFSYNPATNMYAPLSFNNSPIVADTRNVYAGNGVMYSVLGQDKNSGSGTAPNNPARYDKNIYQVRFE